VALSGHESSRICSGKARDVLHVPARYALDWQLFLTLLIRGSSLAATCPMTMCPACTDSTLVWGGGGWGLHDLAIAGHAYSLGHVNLGEIRFT